MRGTQPTDTTTSRTKRLLVTMMLGTTLLGVVTIATGLSAVGASAPMDSPQSPSGVRCSALAAIAPTQPAAPPQETGVANTALATVSIAPIVDVIVGRDGSPRFVDTNTGEPPSCADHFVVFTNETVTGGHLADLSQVNAVLGLTFAGPWTPGDFHTAP